MAYTELVKNLKGIRSYIREFLVYGYKTRDDYSRHKSGRTYDDERRRLKNYLGSYVSYSNTEKGRASYVSFDTRSVSHNPLFAIYKACSFTDLDITLHFCILELLSMKEKMTLHEINEEIFTLIPEDVDFQIDESTIRRKLREYVGLGLLDYQKKGNRILYFVPKQLKNIQELSEALNYYSEVSMCGVVGNYILTNNDFYDDIFIFKHHNPTAVIESDILFEILEAIHNKRTIFITKYKRKSNKERSGYYVPLSIYKSVETGRMYIMVYDMNFGYQSLRLDYISTVKLGEVYKAYDLIKVTFNKNKQYIWNVSLNGFVSDACPQKLEHVSFSIFFSDNEQYVYQRLFSEKRTGNVELIEKNQARFSIDVFDSRELIPWIRTFVSRIINISFSNENVMNLFLSDIKAMNEMYGIGEKE